MIIQQQAASINKINAKREIHQELVHWYRTDLASTRRELQAAKTDFRIESYNTLVLRNCKQRAVEKIIETHMEDRLHSGKDIRSLFTEIEGIIAHQCRFYLQRVEELQAQVDKYQEADTQTEQLGQFPNLDDDEVHQPSPHNDDGPTPT